MVNMQSGVDAGASAGTGEDVLQAEEDNSPSANTNVASLVTLRTEKFSMRRVSGTHIPQTLVRDVYLLCVPQLRERTEQRCGDFGIARLGGVAALNFQRLVYQPSDVA